LETGRCPLEDARDKREVYANQARAVIGKTVVHSVEFQIMETAALAQDGPSSVRGCCGMPGAVLVKHGAHGPIDGCRCRGACACPLYKQRSCIARVKPRSAVLRKNHS